MSLVFSLVFFVVNFSSAQYPLTNGLVAFYPFNGNANDEIGNKNGAIVNAQLTTDRFGNENSAYHFNGVDAKIVMNDNDTFSFTNNIFSVSVWVRVADTASAISILSKRNAGFPFEYSLDNSMGKSSFVLDNWIANGSNSVYGIDPLKARTPIGLNVWMQLIYVADGSTLRCYRNGELMNGEDLRNTNFSFENTNANFEIGNGGAFGVNHFFSGDIDEVRIYNRALSQTEISWLYMSDSTPHQTSAENTFQIFPNPSDGNFSCWFQAQNHELKFSVFNSIGQKIIDATILPEGSGAINLNLQNESAGIYFLMIEEEAKRYTKKLIVE